MKITEIILGTFSVFGLMLLSQHLDGSAIIAAISLGTLALFYLLFSFALLNQISLKAIFQRLPLPAISSLRIAGSISFGIMLCISIISIFFKVNQFPGANMLLWISLIGLALGITVAALRYIPLKSFNSMYPVFIRAIAIGIPVVWLIIR